MVVQDYFEGQGFKFSVDIDLENATYTLEINGKSFLEYPY